MLGRLLKADEFRGLQKVATAVHAYVIGPSGSGKTTYVGKHFPSSKFHVVHSDDYAVDSEKQPGRVKIDWARAMQEAERSGKPVVIDAMHANPELMKAAVHKLLMDPGRVTTMAQLITRRGLRGKKSGYSLTPAEKLERFETKIRPLAERLGFEKVGHVIPRNG